MSLTNPSKVVTEQRLSDFYQGILPYLGGSADAGFTPVGTVISIMSNHAPANYLICNGQVVNISDYTELANHFLNEFGSKNYFGGDGVTTFAVPDLRGEFLRGTGTNSHTNQGNGASVGSHQNATEQNLLSVNDTSIVVQKVTSPNWIANADKQLKTNLQKGYSWVNFVGDDTTNEYMTMFSARPTNTSVLYCIATKNIYLNPSNDYSTDEKVVGTWIDGKPIYQKTIQCEWPIKDDTGNPKDTFTNIGATVDKVIEYKGIWFNSSNGAFVTGVNIYITSTLVTTISGNISSPSMVAGGIANIAINSNSALNNKNTIRIYANEGFLQNQAGSYLFWLTIQYTKTTD